MGVRCKACVAIIFTGLLFGSMWMYGSLEHHLDVCLKIYNPRRFKIKTHSPTDNNSTDKILAPLRVCSGQRFQVAYLLAHLQASPVSTNDVLLKPYLASWEELIRFLEALGPMVGLISKEIESKTTIIQELTQKANSEEGKNKSLSEDDDSATSHDSSSRSSQANPSVKYLSVRSMIHFELENGLVDFQKLTNSGCRTLLRLHRALLWLKSFLDELGKSPTNGSRLQRPSEISRKTYQRTLSIHHSWFVRRAAELAFLAMPERPFFYRLMCVDTQAEAEIVLGRVVRAIGEVYDRTQAALEEHGMLDLP